MKAIIILILGVLLICGEAFAQVPATLDVAIKPLFSQNCLSIGSVDLKGSSTLVDFTANYRHSDTLIMVSHLLRNTKEESVLMILRDANKKDGAEEAKEHLIKSALSFTKLDIGAPLFQVPIYPFFSAEWVNFRTSTDDIEKTMNANGIGAGFYFEQRFLTNAVNRPDIFCHEKFTYIFAGPMRDIELELGMRFLSRQKGFLGAGVTLKNSSWKMEDLEIKNSMTAPFVEIGFWF